MSTNFKTLKSHSKVNLEELVGRSFAKPDLSGLASMLSGKTVLITGAGGSIGSEITRQLSSMKVKKLILVEHSEFNLYRVLEELGDVARNVIPFMANICDYEALRDIFWQHRPDFVYHAAAYKHVHLVEANPSAGIINNIHGTKNLLNLSAEYAIEKFVLVSTDKAVRPTNLMGATKRICELLVSEYATKHGLNASSVRFGNVAGSSGSLIPKLMEQIQERKPITITDKRMTRYFMLIPEAVGLVLKSSETSGPGSITLLNMGESVKIVELAKKLVSMHGLDPEAYPFTFIGKRPGEKLYEELSVEERNLFSGGRQFAHLPEGDRPFKAFAFNGRKYTEVEALANDLAFYARNRNPAAVELTWSAIQSEFESGEAEALQKTTLLESLFKLQVA